MTETAEKQTVQCPIHKREFPLATCLARQKIIATKPTSGLKGEAYNRFKLSCGVCGVGSKLYLEANKNAKINGQTMPKELLGMATKHLVSVMDLVEHSIKSPSHFSKTVDDNFWDLA